MRIVNASQIANVKKFVREGLGCGCSDDVFQDIRVRRGSVWLKDWPVEYELEIGGRLLIAVVWEAPQSLEQLIADGRQARDKGRFNRFRLVILCEDPARAETTLVRQFETISTRDERTHLHVLAKSDLPDLEDR